MQGKTHRPFAVAFTATTLTLMHNKISCYTESQTLIDIVQVTETIVAAYVAGVLPDIDQILPIPHRTITHAIWIPLITMIVAFKMFLTNTFVFPILFGVSIGWFSHLFGDAFSKAGLAWFWPFQGYVRYPSGAFVVKGFRGPFIPIYTSGDSSFAFMTVIWRIVAVLMIIIMIWRLFIL